MSIIPITIFGSQLTSSEVTFIQNLSGLTYAQGDILYYNGTVLTNLGAGTNGHYLKTQGAGANPTWAAVAGGGDVSKVGTPVNNQVGVWTGDGTLEGDAALTFDTATDTLSSGTFLGTALTASELTATDASKNIVSLAVATYPSLTEISYVKGLTSAVQTQLGTKAPTTAPTFATSITGSYLTASEMLITDGSKNIVSAPVATYPSLTELTYLKGVTSAIQTQLNAKGVGDMVLASVQSVTGLKTFDTTKLAIKGSSTGSTAIASANAGATDYTQTLQAKTGTIANSDDTFYIGTTQLALNRASAALTLAGLTLTTPDIGTPSAGVLTNATGLPIAGLVASTSTAIGVGSIELGHATDTTLSRVSAGVIAVEGVTVPTISSTNTLTNKRISKRIYNTTSTATLTPEIDTYDDFELTAQAANITIANHSTSTPVQGDCIFIMMTPDATPRTITFGTNYVAKAGTALPTTTVASKSLSMFFRWSAGLSKYVLLASGQEA